MQNLKVYFIVLTLLFDCVILHGQSDNNQQSIIISPTQNPIKLDGHLSEKIWQKADTAKNFYMNFPSDNTYAKAKTEVRVIYDEQFVFIGAVCYDSLEGDPIVTSLKRDFDIYNNDAFMAIIGPFEDNTNGFLFALTPFGVQAEATIAFGDELSVEWDNKWYSAVSRSDDYWSLEMAIPLKTLRYTKESRTWNFNFARNYRKLNELSSWIPVPLNFDIYSLAFSGNIVWSESLRDPGKNLSVIPYITGDYSENIEEEQKPSYEIDAGFDAKWVISPSLNLDITANPDFSQVEVDQQVTNLQRFELFFPERRQFFLENSDLFGGFGVDNNRPFFSRRIGLVNDAENARNIESRIHFGARLSGKLDKNWRLGLMNIQTGRNREVDLLPTNFTVLALQRQVFSRSNISALLINKQNTGAESSDNNAFNRLVGIEYNLASRDNTWNGKSYYHHSFNPSDSGHNFTHGANIEFNRKKIIVNLDYEHVGENYNPEVGFVQRRGYWKTNPKVEYRHFSNNKIIYHGPVFSGLWLKNTDWSLLDRNYRLNYNFVFTNNSSLRFLISNYFIKLVEPFDPTNSGGVPLETGSEHRYTRYSIQFFSDPRKLFSYEVLLFDGGFFNGRRLSINTLLNYRFQPYVNLSLTFNYEKLAFPSPQSDADFFLIGPNASFSFTDKLFLTTYIQYNSQIDNINLNTRLQWRFMPVSDLFIVYTDNYLPGSLRTKNRSLVFKVNYWFNL